MSRAPRTCSRCGARGHDVRACTLTPPTADALLSADDDDRNEESAAEEAEATEADASPWDPDDVPAAPPAVTVPAPRRRPRLVVGEAVRVPAPLTLLMFASGDCGVTVVAHELRVDIDEATVIVDAWDKPAILAVGRRFVHMPKRVPVGLVLAAARHLRGAA